MLFIGDLELDPFEHAITVFQVSGLIWVKEKF